MSLDRKDIRAKLDPDMHEALVKICERDGVDIGEFIEREIERILLERIHKAIIDADAIQDLGITRKIREQQGIAQAGRR